MDSRGLEAPWHQILVFCLMPCVFSFCWHCTKKPGYPRINGSYPQKLAHAHLCTVEAKVSG
jgi:hypothetical protein